MFGFSITKLLFTVAVVFAIWQGFKFVGRLQSKREADARDRVRRAKRSPASSRGSSSSRDSGDVTTEDMIKCATCGDYVAAKGARNCGRDNCPYPG